MTAWMHPWQRERMKRRALSPSSPGQASSEQICRDVLPIGWVAPRGGPGGSCMHMHMWRLGAAEIRAPAASSGVQAFGPGPGAVRPLRSPARVWAWLRLLPGNMAMAAPCACVAAHACMHVWGWQVGAREKFFGVFGAAWVGFGFAGLIADLQSGDSWVSVRSPHGPCSGTCLFALVHATVMTL